MPHSGRKFDQLPWQRWNSHSRHPYIQVALQQNTLDAIRQICGNWHKNFYLNTPMAQYEYMRLTINIIPQEIINEYHLMTKVKNGFIFCEILQGMYILPQAVMIANKLLVEWLANHGYRTCELTPGLWKHEKSSDISLNGQWLQCKICR